jgi:hypothetical protein
VLSLVALALVRTFRARCWLGYAPLTLALVSAFVIYVLNGRLGDVRIGPIPAGTPVNLLASLNPEADPADLKRAIRVTTSALAEIESKHLGAPEAQAILRERVAPELMRVSRCPDFVMDQGHYFEWFASMTDDDKDALVELLKTF